MFRFAILMTGAAGCVAPPEAPNVGLESCAPPDAEPEPDSSGHLTDGWRWMRTGPIFSDTDLFGASAEIGYNEGALAPTLVDTGRGLHLLYMLKRGTETSLWATTSVDGTDWSLPVAVTGLEESGQSYPSLVFDEEMGFRLWFGSGSIAWASSSDGVSFSVEDTVLRAGDAEFDSLSLLYPHALQTLEGIRLYYTGFDGMRFAVGEADCDLDGSQCTGAGPILERDVTGWDNTSVAMPEVVVTDAGTFFWYGGYDTQIADPGPWRVGQVVEGERRLSLPLGEMGEDAWSTRDPAVVPWREGWLMVYVGMGDDGRYRLLSATSDVCADL